MSQYSIVTSSGCKYTIPKPPEFKLKDLPIYSKTLANKGGPDKMRKFEMTVLGGKYFRGIRDVEKQKVKRKALPKEEGSLSNRQKNIDWSTTPVYK